jgi:tRNA (guanine37-N1)-methyltransferase
MKVPEVLLSGNHAKIAQWRKQKAVEKTRINRPELLKNSN